MELSVSSQNIVLKLHILMVKKNSGVLFDFRQCARDKNAHFVLALHQLTIFIYSKQKQNQLLLDEWEDFIQIKIHYVSDYISDVKRKTIVSEFNTAQFS